MNFLLDTHAILWWLDDSSKLSKKARDAISDPNNRIFVSIVSVVEIQIKQRIGKLKGVPENIEAILLNSPFYILDFTITHATAVGDFDYYHSDPFDWMLIAQSRVENLTFVTRDREIQKYDVRILKA